MIHKKKEKINQSNCGETIMNDGKGPAFYIIHEKHLTQCDFFSGIKST